MTSVDRDDVGDIKPLAKRSAKRPAKRLAIIGCGSSGLVTLKTALDFLPDWEVTAFEQSGSIRGCWGDPHPGFVSTSTRYTTQFACFPKWKATVSPDGGQSREEFFRDSEYGDYLDEFAVAFKLHSHIRLHTRVENMQRLETGGWRLRFDRDVESCFDSVIVCTGLAAIPKPIDSTVPCLSANDLNLAERLSQINDKTIVVLGGGESAVDYANRLARPDLNNQVYLSLRSGVRVSPRYHPVRGVPSDFLRNRLMLSADPAIRNWLGQIFVLARIKYQNLFETLFPAKHRSQMDTDLLVENRKALWAKVLTLAAKDDLFNMFHNKSDDFLQAVGEDRITIVGPPLDNSFQKMRPFEYGPEVNQEAISIRPDFIVRAIGYQSTLGQLSQPGQTQLSVLSLSDFYLGCCHAQFADTYAVGYARPIIGNIPSISEMQARYVCGLIAGEFRRPGNIAERHLSERSWIQNRYQNLDAGKVFPVEMFPYCDQLAKLMNRPIGPRLLESPLGWLRTRLAPATTMHYFQDQSKNAEFIEEARVYMPPLLILLILFVKPFDWVFRLTKWIFGRS